MHIRGGGRQCGMVTFATSGDGRFPKHVPVGGDIVSSYWWRGGGCRFNNLQVCFLS